RRRPRRSPSAGAGAERRCSAAAGDRRQDRDLVTVPDGGFEALAEADVLATDVDVHEAAQLADLGDAFAQAVVAAVERVQRLPDRRAFDLRLRLVPGEIPELSRDLDRDAHHQVPGAT